MDEFVVFQLDALQIALALPSVERVVRAVYITPLPDAPDIVLGIVNVQGRIVSVVNMRKRFHLPDREIALTDQLVIAHTTRYPVALVADVVTGVLEYPEQNIIGPKEFLPGLEHVSGVVRLQDGLILIHDLDKFLSLEEEKCLNQAMEAR